MKKSLKDSLDAFDTAQSIDAWDDACSIDDELDAYFGKSKYSGEITVDYIPNLWPERPNRVFSSILNKMIDTKTGLPVEEE